MATSQALPRRTSRFLGRLAGNTNEQPFPALLYFNQEKNTMEKFIVLTAQTIDADSIEAAQERAKKLKHVSSLVLPSRTDQEPLDIGRSVVAWFNRRFVTSAVIVLMLATMAFGRDHFDWKPLEILQTDSAKIGTATEGHRFGPKRYMDVEQHVFDAKGIGNLRYQLSSRHEVIAPGIYEGALIDKGRKMRVRVDGRREVILNIESISVAPAAPAPVAEDKTKLEWENMTMKKDAQADPSKFIIRPDPSSPLSLCTEIVTNRDGSQSCWRWADKPGK
jgi:hypothetical protein